MAAGAEVIIPVISQIVSFTGDRQEMIGQGLGQRRIRTLPKDMAGETGNTFPVYPTVS